MTMENIGVIFVLQVNSPIQRDKRRVVVVVPIGLEVNAPNIKINGDKNRAKHAMVRSSPKVRTVIGERLAAKKRQRQPGGGDGGVCLGSNLQ